MKLTITKEHLQKAIAARTGNYSISQICIVSQAAMEVIPNCWGSAGRNIYANDDTIIYRSDKLHDIMSDFDNYRYKELEQKLPITIELIEAKISNGRK